MARGPAPQRPHPARAVGPTAWERLSGEIRACTLCPLSQSRTHAVVYRGGAHPRVVLVGEAPGHQEDLAGLPFVGRAGRTLDEGLAEIGLPPDRVGIINLIKCRPPENRFDPAAARACRPYLDRQLDLLAPQAVVTLGRHALRALAPEAPPILVAAGHAHEGPRGTVFALLHPAAPLHAPRLSARWHSDLGRLREWLAGLGTQTS